MRSTNSSIQDANGISSWTPQHRSNVWMPSQHPSWPLLWHGWRVSGSRVFAIQVLEFICNILFITVYYVYISTVHTIDWLYHVFLYIFYLRTIHHFILYYYPFSIYFSSPSPRYDISCVYRSALVPFFCNVKIIESLQVQLNEANALWNLVEMRWKKSASGAKSLVTTKGFGEVSIPAGGILEDNCDMRQCMDEVLNCYSCARNQRNKTQKIEIKQYQYIPVPCTYLLPAWQANCANSTRNSRISKS